MKFIRILELRICVVHPPNPINGESRSTEAQACLEH